MLKRYEYRKLYLKAILEIKNPIIANDIDLYSWKKKAIKIIYRIYKSGGEKKEHSYLKLKNALGLISYNEHENTAGIAGNTPQHTKQINKFIDDVISDINDVGTTKVNILTEALHNELTENQLFEIQESIKKNEKKVLKKTKLIEKFKFSEKDTAINIISRIYRSDSEKQERRYLKFKNDIENIVYTNGRENTAEIENNIPQYDKQISNFIDDVISGIHDVETSEVNILTEALRYELTGKQLFEIREIIKKNEKKALKKVKLIEKFKFFEKDTVINIISRILTNSAILVGEKQIFSKA